MFELIGQKRLERRPAPRAFAGATLGAMDTTGEDVDDISR
jgi:hypothetical protein